MALIGSNLRHLRNERKLSQQELADLVGIGRTTIANIEANLANPVYQSSCRLPYSLPGTRVL
ncbi:MAG: helix-turn-helix transcriptional regulator [Bacteroidetes bacterium]|nr:helix-turn-helix transcriptional regulator [Bacteroidota bacterium]